MAATVAPISSVATAATASTETTIVTATLAYSDANQGGAARPIRDSKVEVWRFRPAFLGIWTWNNDRTVFTDGAGRISVTMPYETAGVIYALRVVAENRAVVVKPSPRTMSDWIPSALQFDGAMWREPGDNLPIQPRSSGPGQTLDLSWTFSGWSAQHYNISDALLYARDHAAARRGDNDILDQVTVTWQTVEDWFVHVPFYNPVGSQIRIPVNAGGASYAYDDQTMIHEYAHYLEHHLGDFSAQPTVHSGCDGYNAEHAWMEGFADYYSIAVAYANPAANLRNYSGNPVAAYFPSCSGNGDVGRTLESRVAKSLWDLRDHVTVFQIFDRQLDYHGFFLGVADNCPTINDFRRGWQRRGRPLADLDNVLAGNGISVLDGPRTGGNCTSAGTGPTSTLNIGNGTITYTAEHTKCVDVNNGDTRDGTPVIIWDCNGGANQRWTFTAGTLRSMGKCVDVPGGGTTPGIAVQLWTCNGTGAQAWVHDSWNGVLRNPQSGKCLDLRWGYTGNSTPVQIWDCNNSAAQRWS